MDNDKLNYYARYYFSNYKPIPFKLKYNNYIIYIKPVTVEMSAFYHDNIDILLIDKNVENSVEIISMSYLQYLIDVLFVDEERQKMLVTILKLSLGDEYVYTMGHDEKGKVYLGIVKENKTVSRITPKEFDKISDIILNYNDPNFENRHISTDMRKAMEEYYKIKFKDQYMPTLEEKKLFVSFKSGLTLKEINEMAYRHFEIMYNQCVNNDIFFSQKILQASEKYKIDDLVYPLFKKKESRFDFLQKAETFEKKVSRAAQG